MPLEFYFNYDYQKLSQNLLKYSLKAINAAFDIINSYRHKIINKYIQQGNFPYVSILLVIFQKYLHGSISIEDS